MTLYIAPGTKPSHRATRPGPVAGGGTSGQVGLELDMKNTQWNRRLAILMTGAILPEGCDTVIPYEHIESNDAVANIKTPVNFRQNVHFEGSDYASGEVLVEAGCTIGSAEIAVAATIGKAELRVAQSPKIAIVSTGDELVDVQAADDALL